MNKDKGSRGVLLPARLMDGVSHSRGLRSLWKRAERGDDASFEFTVAMVPLMLMISLIALATIVRASQVPAWTAASECARAAIATLNEDIGVAQGKRAAMNSLSGNFLLTTGLTVDVDYGTWDRGSSVTCKVNYGIDVSGIVMLNGLFPGDSIPMNAEVSLRVEKFKSRWGS